MSDGYRFPAYKAERGDLVVQKFVDPYGLQFGIVTRVALDKNIYSGGLIEVDFWYPVSGDFKERVVYPQDLEFIGRLDALGVELI